MKRGAPPPLVPEPRLPGLGVPLRLATSLELVDELASRLPSHPAVHELAGDTVRNLSAALHADVAVIVRPAPRARWRLAAGGGPRTWSQPWSALELNKPAPDGERAVVVIQPGGAGWDAVCRLSCAAHHRVVARQHQQVDVIVAVGRERPLGHDELTVLREHLAHDSRYAEAMRLWHLSLMLVPYVMPGDEGSPVDLAGDTEVGITRSLGTVSEEP